MYVYLHHILNHMLIPNELQTNLEDTVFHDSLCEGY